MYETEKQNVPVKYQYNIIKDMAAQVAGLSVSHGMTEHRRRGRDDSRQ